MKFILVLFLVLTIIVIPPASGYVFSDRTGLKYTFPVETGGYNFDVELVGNFDVKKMDFDKDRKMITFTMFNSLDENLTEIIIPKNLINGEFTFYLYKEHEASWLPGVEVFPRVQMSEQISFIFLEFEGTGIHKLEIIGTTYLPEFADVAPLVLASSMIGLVLLKRFKKTSVLFFNLTK